jgi:hypothetical protein
MKVWKNADKDSRAVAIKSVAFDFDVLRESDEDGEDLSSTIAVKEKIPSSRNIAVAQKIDSLFQQVSNLSRLVVFGAVVIVIAFYLFK